MNLIWKPYALVENIRLDKACPKLGEIFHKFATKLEGDLKTTMN